MTHTNVLFSTLVSCFGIKNDVLTKKIASLQIESFSFFKNKAIFVQLWFFPQEKHTWKEIEKNLLERNSKECPIKIPQESSSSKKAS